MKKKSVLPKKKRSMRKIWIGALLGGATGATAVAIKSYQDDEPIDVLVSKSAKIGAESAAAGAVAGGLLARRSRKRRAQKALRKAARKSALNKWNPNFSPSEASRALAPALYQAREGVTHAADYAWPRVDAAAEHAAEAARQALHTARPMVGHAAQATKAAASHAAETASHKFAK